MIKLENLIKIFDGYFIGIKRVSCKIEYSKFFIGLKSLREDFCVSYGLLLRGYIYKYIMVVVGRRRRIRKRFEGNDVGNF